MLHFVKEKGRNNLKTSVLLDKNLLIAQKEAQYFKKKHSHQSNFSCQFINLKRFMVLSANLPKPEETRSHDALM